MSEQKYCTHCGAPIPENARFCTKCGASVDTTYGADGNFAGNQSYQSTYSSAHEEHVRDDNRNSMAIASLVLGILSLFIPYLNLIFSIIAIVLGSKTKDINYGKAGMIIGVVTLVISIIVDVLVCVAICFGFSAAASGSSPWVDVSATVGTLASLLA